MACIIFFCGGSWLLSYLATIFAKVKNLEKDTPKTAYGCSYIPRLSFVNCPMFHHIGVF